MVLETDFCTNIELRYQSGYFFIFWFFINVCVNIFHIFRPMLMYKYLAFKWLLIRINRRLSILCKRLDLNRYLGALLEWKPRTELISIPEDPCAGLDILKLNEDGSLNPLQQFVFKLVEQLELKLMKR
jgi:hypothetical protein